MLPTASLLLAPAAAGCAGGLEEPELLDLAQEPGHHFSGGAGQDLGAVTLRGRRDLLDLDLRRARAHLARDAEIGGRLHVERLLLRRHDPLERRIADLI